MARKRKYDLPDEPVTRLPCRSCGEERELGEYRVFKTGPTRHMDFCLECERRWGTLTLYRRYNAYGTDEIAKAVFAAARLPEGRRSSEQVRLLVLPDEKRDPETKEELVKRELARRELARRRLIYYVNEFHPGYSPGWCHQDICRRLEKFVADVEAGLSPRLMICMPPRAGKSALASDLFPSWLLGKHPEWPVIAASYAQSLPVKFSRSIRDRIQDPEHRAIFPELEMRKDAKGVEEWMTTKGGGYIAAGVGTGITGKGFMVGIIDDPIKDQEEASSELIRDNAWDWYQSTFRTRAAPGAGILIIQTRWHWHDVAGHALEQDEQLKKAGVPVEERENWEVVSYPALAEGDEHLMRDGTIQQDPEDLSESLRLLRRKGEALHPERYPLAELRKLKNNLSSSIWNALYQQKPTPDEGDFFVKDDFRYRWLDPAYRPLCRILMTVDYAIGKKQRNDYTVMGVWALDSNNDLYLLEVRRGRWKTQEIVDNAVALIERHKPEVYAGEQGQIHLAVWPLIEQALAQKRLFVSVDNTLVPIQDKEVRARPLQSRMQMRKLFFSYDDQVKPDIYDITERELLQFPNGAHDDIVDMMAWGARLAQNTSLPTYKAPPKKEGWMAKLNAAVIPRSPMAA